MISLKLRCIREYNRVYTHLLRWIWRFQGQDAARVYMFHSVVESPDQVYSPCAITCDSFERFIRYELSRGQQPVDAETLKQAVDNPAAFANHFVVSFDDIYDSVYSNAYPVLKKLHVPFVLFVTPSLIDNIDPSSKHPMITMAHLREMASDPLCIIAAHGMNHVAFRELTEAQAHESMAESKQWLEKEFGKPVNFFAFPFGRRVEVSNANIRIVSTCGFYCAFSALDGSLSQKWLSGNWFLPRILVDERYVGERIKK